MLDLFEPRFLDDDDDKDYSGDDSEHIDDTGDDPTEPTPDTPTA